jgi:hypothetical protein
MPAIAGPVDRSPTEVTVKKNTTAVAPTVKLSVAAASRAALADAHSRAADWTTEHAAAVKAARALIERLARGDDSVTGEALGSAHFEQVRTEELVRAGKALVRKANHGIVNDDTKLADLFAAILTETFRGLVPVQVVTTNAEVVRTGEPVAYVLQEREGADRGGILSGKLTLSLHRSALLAALSADRVTQLAEARGFLTEVIGQPSTVRHGTDHEDTVHLQVGRAFAAVPVLSTAPSVETVRYFAQGLPGALSGIVRATDPNASIRLMGEPPASNARGELVSHRIVSSEHDGDEQRLTVEVVTRVTPSPALRTNPYPLIHSAVAQYKGTVEAGLGRIVEVGEAVISAPDRVVPGYRQPHTVTTRFVFAYQLAAV